VKAHPWCSLCLIHWVYERALAQVGDRAGPELVRGILKVLMNDFSLSANVGSLCNGTVFAANQFTAPGNRHYEELKRKSNENAKALLGQANDYINAGKTKRERFERACFLAAAANVAPLNPPAGAYAFDEMQRVMSGRDGAPLVTGDIYGAARKAQRIIYVTDNAGEIAFDSLVIRMLKQMGIAVTLVVKSRTFFEDATMEDARFFGLDKLADRTERTEGFLVLNEAPEPLREAYGKSDLVIAKGTGSYEALRGETGGKPAIFMLKVKCGPIAQETGIAEGNMVVRLERPKAVRLKEKKGC
jgi:damage-control phosphatase, subfamily I